MRFTRTERLLLANQYRILEKLYPDEAGSYATWREALESGYELHYGWIAEHIYEDVMTDAECREVVDILDMHRALKRAYEALADKSGIEEWKVKFSGFDGNNECKQMGYARYFCAIDGPHDPRFPEVDRGDNFNSHCPTLKRYRAMLAEWNKSGAKQELTRDDVVRIIDAKG
ncbi:MAG: YfbU family protein [Patescibacteria group bacterium]|jgi:hypothetical protein|nr:YfbU family protein [Patescibacteria group bacterium]